MLNERIVLVVLSGGQDSTTCLIDVIEKVERHGMFDQIHAVTFDYGQRHSVEIEAATKIWRMMKAIYGDELIASHEVITLPGDVLKSISPLVSAAELEQYSDHNSLPGGLEKTFVPMRNQLFLTIAANRAVDLRAATLVTGVCQEDFGGYPDCRQVFVDAVEAATNRGLGLTHSDMRMNIATPLMNLTKAATVAKTAHNPLALAALAYSHTAYDGQYPPTGHDHATLLREKGFVEAGRPDPLIVRAHMEGLMGLPKTSNYRDDDGYLDFVKIAVREGAAALGEGPAPTSF